MQEYRETIREANVEGGRIRGIMGNNPIYTVFKGVPYAAPPVGDLRWKAPQPVIPWEGTRICYEFGPIGDQAARYNEFLYGREFFQNTDPRGEDCLYLNIWTPAKSREDKLPVLFWIHGGGFFGGAGTEPEFDGEGFCRRRVILVTINYRLGAMGFMAHPELTAESEHHTSGNYGIQDQIAAFHWVRNNIVEFGGDPDKITIAGQSAGSMSVCCLMTSPLCRDELAGAILQSSASVGNGGPLIEKSLAEAEQQGVAFMEKHGCKNIAEMRKLPVEALRVGHPALSGGFGFTPIADGYVLPDQTGKAVLEGVHPAIPYMCGSTASEGGSDLDDPTQMRKIVPQILSSGNMGFCLNEERLGRDPVYAFCFSRELPGEDHPGAFHACELWYEFETLNRCWRPFNGIDFDLAVTMADYVANFVKTGNPNGEGLPQWSAYTKDSPRCMNLGENVGMIDAPITEFYQNKLKKMLGNVWEEIK